MKSYKINVRFIRDRMEAMSLTSDEVARLLGFSSVHGFNKILREAQTKLSTVDKIADILKVHRDALDANRRAYQNSVLVESKDETDLIKLHRQILDHENRIQDLDKKYTKLLEKLQGLS